MQNEHLFGQYLVHNGIITSEQLLQAIECQNSISKTLGTLAIGTGKLKDRDIENILVKQWEDNLPFGQAAVSLDLLKPEDVEELLEVQKKLTLPLGELLIQNNALDREKLDSALTLYRREKRSPTKHAIALLRRIPLFSNLHTRELAEISLMLESREASSGELIYQEGDKSDHLFLITSGLVRITISTESEEVELGYLKHGEYFGLESVISRNARMEKARAIMNTSLLCLSWENLHKLLTGENRNLALAAAKNLGENMQALYGSMKKHKEPFIDFITLIIIDGMDRTGIENRIVSATARLTRGKTLAVTSAPSENLETGASEERMKAVKWSDDIYRLDVAVRGEQDLFQETSVWLSENGMKFGSIIFVLSASFINDYQFILNICHRSISILKEGDHAYLSRLKPGRDRAYLQYSPSRSDNRKAFRSLLKACPEVLAPHMFRTHDDKHADMAARWLTGTSMGIAFSGGGARGLAHIGVMEVLTEEGLVFDAVAGSSAGAFMSALVACGHDIGTISDYFYKYSINTILNPFCDLAVPRTSLVRGKRFEKILQITLEDRCSIETDIACFPVAVNMENGEEVIVKERLLRESVRASCSPPGLLPPARYDGIVFGDGGLINNLPSSVLKRYGMDLIVSVDVMVGLQSAAFNPKSILSIFGRALDIMVQESAKLRSDFSDVTIRPDVSKFKLLEYRAGRELIANGRKAALEKLPEIRNAIQHLKEKRK